MSNLLWKSLLISPAVLSAALVVSGQAIAAEKQVISEVSQSQTVQAKVKEAPLVAIAADPEASAVNVKTDFSTNAAALEPSTGASVSVPAAVAVKPSETISVQPDKTSAQLNLAQPVAMPLAQSIPVAQPEKADPVNTGNLDQILRYSNEGSENTTNSNSLGQVTNVSQFRDVQPSDWAYEALSRVVEKYGCLQGYPDGTFRGNRALSRYEFAAGLNACLRQIEALIQNNQGGTGGVSQTDFEALQRLTEEFRTELATLGTRVDNLEGRTAFLEQRQFSTTTKLAGEAIFALTDTLDDNPNSTVLGDRVRLDLRTSFTGRDTLHTRLAAGNLRAFDFTTNGPNSPLINTHEGVQTFNLTPDTSNGVKLDWLSYYFPFGASKVYLAATGGIHSDYAATNNPYFEDYDGGNGALSVFAQESPIYRIGGGAGGAVTLGLGKGGGLLRPTGLTIGYLADNPNEARGANGIFRGSYAALGQLNFNVSDRAALALTYVHGYHYPGDSIFDLGGPPRAGGSPLGVVGTGVANDIRSINPLLGGSNMSTNSYGASIALRPSNAFSLSGFVTKTSARTGLGAATVDADIWSYGAGLAFPNFGKEGNVLGFFAGVEPTLKGLDVRGGAIPGGTSIGTNDNAYHFEGFYKYQLTDNVSVTPGVIWLTNPGQNSNNQDAVIGTLRTTFTF